MMAGKKSKVKPEDFLPFDTKQIKKEDGVTDASLIVLQRLMKTRRMDGRVIALLADELKAFAGRNHTPAADTPDTPRPRAGWTLPGRTGRQDKRGHP